jgi:hypothetical protein
MSGIKSVPNGIVRMDMSKYFSQMTVEIESDFIIIGLNRVDFGFRTQRHFLSPSL